MFVTGAPAHCWGPGFSWSLESLGPLRFGRVPLLPRETHCMGSSTFIIVLIAAASAANSIPQVEVKKQNTVFAEQWNDDFVWNFEDLPTKGSVPKERVPYSGYIYLDKYGGTRDVMTKYDRAFNRGYPATSWEAADTAAAKQRRGLFSSQSRNDWYGHCNGWTSATIRHAEPQKSVRANGVTFTPADIKGLLAEMYMYNDHVMLAGENANLNPGTLHAILANWLGRGSHPIAMDSDPGEEKWNYPMYSFASGFAQRSARELEVRTNVLYAKDSEDREFDKSPRMHKMKSLHYMLHLDDRGNIVGGYYFGDSDRIDFVWVPLQPKQPGEKGNEAGNPHLDITEVMDIWRQSVPRAARRKWLIVDLADKDRAVEVEDPSRILPRNIRIVPPSRTELTGAEKATDETSDDVIRMAETPVVGSDTVVR